MQKFIKVSPKIRVELLKEIAVSESTLYNALNFATSGYTAESIRRRALELGGVLYEATQQESTTEEAAV